MHQSTRTVPREPPTELSEETVTLSSQTSLTSDQHNKFNNSDRVSPNSTGRSATVESVVSTIFQSNTVPSHMKSNANTRQQRALTASLDIDPDDIRGAFDNDPPTPNAQSTVSSPSTNPVEEPPGGGNKSKSTQMNHSAADHFQSPIAVPTDSIDPISMEMEENAVPQSQHDTNGEKKDDLWDDIDVNDNGDGDDQNKQPQLSQLAAPKSSVRSKRGKHKDSDKPKKKKSLYTKCRRRFRKYRRSYNGCRERCEERSCCKGFRRFQFLCRKYVTTTALFRAIKISEIIFTIIFALEMVIKMIANGLFGWHMDNGESTADDDMDIEAEKEQNKKNEAKHPKKESLQLPINQTGGKRSSATYSAGPMDPVHGVELAQLHTKKGTANAMDTNNVTIRTPSAEGNDNIANTNGAVDTAGNTGNDKNDTNDGMNTTNSNVVTLQPAYKRTDSTHSCVSVSSYDSTVIAPSVSSEKGQNDVDPNQYVGYFRDNWNILDFIIVITSLIEFIDLGGSNLTPIRVLRVLRPLRTFTKIPDLKVLITTIIEALKGLKNVLCLLMFLFVVFAIIGIQLFQGLLHQQCFSDDFRIYPNNGKDLWESDPTAWEMDEYFCKLRPDTTGNNDTTYSGCPDHLPWCLNIAPNPNSEVTSFDNVGSALINVFVTITLEGWANIQYKLRDAGAPLYWVYFIMLTFIVGFFAANLCLAIIESVYSKKMEDQQKNTKAAASNCEALTLEEEANGDAPCGKCMKCKMKKAEEDTRESWRRQKKAKVMLMHTPSDNAPIIATMSPSDSSGGGGGGDGDGKGGDGNGNETGTTTQVSSPNVNGMESIDSVQNENENRLHIKDSGLQAVPSHASDDMPPDVGADKLESAKSDGIYILNGNGTNNNGNGVGTAGSSGNGSIESSKMSSNPKPILRSKSAGHTLKKKKKFQEPLGVGTHVYMHRFRTNTVPKSKPLALNGQVSADAMKSMTSLHTLFPRDDSNVPRLGTDGFGKQMSISRDFVPTKMLSAPISSSNEQVPIGPEDVILNGNHNKNNNGNKDGNGNGMGSPSEGSPQPLNLQNLQQTMEDHISNNTLDPQNQTQNNIESIDSPSSKSAKSKGRLRGLTQTAEDRRLQFQSSRSHTSNQSMSMSMSTQQKKAKKIVNLKVDFKAKQGNDENFMMTLARMRLHVNAKTREVIRRDFEREVQGKNGSVDDDGNGGNQQWDGCLVDDITFGDVPAQDAEMSEQERKEAIKKMNEGMRTKARAKEKERRHNEVEARYAILSANDEPPWKQWMDQHGENYMIRKINALVTGQTFQHLIMLIIILNTVVLALNWPNQSEELKDILADINLVFTFIFIAEAILKLIGLGHKAYFMDNWNIFDFIIVLVSIVELVIEVAGNNEEEDSGGSALSALRAMRLMRAFRLLGKFDKLRQLFTLVLSSLREVSVLSFVMMVFIFMFAALGMSLFGGKLIEAERNGRWRFDQFGWAFFLVFQLISGDSWNEVMYDTVNATGTQVVCLYYIALVCFGSFVILNLFVAILLSKVGSESASEDALREDLIKYSKKMFKYEVDEEEQVTRLLMKIERQKYLRQMRNKKKEWKHDRDKKAMQGKSLGIFEPTNKFRILCHRIVHWRWFEVSIDTLIIINCVALALESPATAEKWSDLFNFADYFFTATFVLEFILKVVALGAMKQPFRAKRQWKRIKDDDTLLPWTDKAFQARAMMQMFLDQQNQLRDDPGLAIECVQSNDGYCVVHYWSLQVLRVVFKQKEYIDEDGETQMVWEWATCYKLANQEEGQWTIWHKEWPEPDDEELETVFKSFDLTDHHHNAYFASNWNRLDALVVFVALLGTVVPTITFLKALRAFRPFRIMVRFKKAKVVLGSLTRAIPGLFNTILFCILFWLVLSILGVNWFSGLYSHCRIDDEEIYFNDNNIPSSDSTSWTGCSDLSNGTWDIWNGTTTNYLDPCYVGLEDRVCDDLCDEECIPYVFGKEQCECFPGLVWYTSVFNFDHVFQALHLIFCVASLSGWNYVMYEAVDSSEYEQHLIEDNKPSAAIYFIVIVVLCSFFSLNLIVSVVVGNFNEIKAEKDGSAFQTEEDRLWTNNKRNLNRIQLDPNYAAPANWFRRLSFHVVEHNSFDPFIMFCIIANAVSMASEHWNQSDDFSLALRIADYFFVIIFAVEAVMKIAGYGFGQYIMDNWNKFDFVISIVGVVGLVSGGLPGLSVIRLFRVGRLLRLLNKMKTLNALFWTLVYSIQSVWNISLLLFVILFIYAVIGMSVLEPYSNHAMSGVVNADNFIQSMAMLYRVGTEDGWTDIYIAYLEESENAPVVYVYFMSYFVVGTLVAINLFIAVVLDSFSENESMFKREDEFEIISIWRDIWSYFDPEATKEIPVRDFIDILKLTPRSNEFFKKHHREIIGPGFFKDEHFGNNPFRALYQRTTAIMNMHSNSKATVRGSSWKLSRTGLPGLDNESGDIDRVLSNSLPSPQHQRTESTASAISAVSDVSTMTADDGKDIPMVMIYRRLHAMFDIESRKEKLRMCRMNVKHEEMIKLLLLLRIRVRIRNENEENLNCCGRIAKLVLDTFGSMGMRSESAEKWVKDHATVRGNSMNEGLGIDKKDLEDIKNGADNNDDDDDDGGGGTDMDTDTDDDDEPWPKDAPFDEGDKTWYISFEDALLALCSETIGPRLPDYMFLIEDPDNQMHIDEWYMIKNDCYDVWKRVKLEIEDQKQFSHIVPSKNMTDDKELKLKSERPHQNVSGVQELKERVLKSHSHSSDEASDHSSLLNDLEHALNHNTRAADAGVQSSSSDSD